MKSKYIAISLITLLILGSGYYLYKSNVNAKNSEKKLTAYAVKMGDITVGFDSEGKFLTDIVEPAFVVSGKISSVNVISGQEVKKGDLLATIDNTETAYDVKNAKANLDKAVAAHHAFEANLASLDTSKFDSDTWKYYSEQENQLRDASKSAQVLYDKARYTLSKSNLYSPIEGTVIDIYFKQGETVQNQNQSNPIMAILPKNSTPYVESNVEDIDISKVTLGMKVTFTPDANDSKKYTGKVTFVSPKGNTDNNGLVTYKVRLELDNTEGLYDGFVGNVTFISKEKQGVLVVPNKAVKVIDGKQYVFEYPNSEKKIEIETGFTDGKNVEVAEGLKLNDQIAISQ